ncbi:MAG: hypothetical protein LBB12_04690 [Holosporaceae bacterium]|jgi:hypothetical protein|nr:hypothetical protein [Holosporaceae bacterium]
MKKQLLLPLLLIGICNNVYAMQDRRNPSNTNLNLRVTSSFAHHSGISDEDLAQIYAALPEEECKQLLATIAPASSTHNGFSDEEIARKSVGLSDEQFKQLLATTPTSSSSILKETATAPASSTPNCSYDEDLAQISAALPEEEFKRVLATIPSSSPSILKTAKAPTSPTSSTSADVIILNNGKVVHCSKVPPDGNCGYTALGVTRKDVANGLLSMLKSRYAQFVRDALSRQMRLASLFSEKFKAMLNDVEKINSDIVTWYITEFIASPASDFSKKYGKYCFLNFMDLSIGIETGDGLGALLATMLQKTIHVIEKSTEMLSFVPAPIPTPLIRSIHQQQSNDLWLLFNGSDHYDTAIVK